MLKELDLFMIENGHSLYMVLPKLFKYENSLEWTLCDGEVVVGDLKRGLDTSIFKGKYIVVNTKMDGGHYVTARKIVNVDGKEKVSDFEISFYQSGLSTCVNADITAIGMGKSKKEYIL